MGFFDDGSSWSFLLQSLQATFFFLFTSFALAFSAFSFLIYSFRLSKLPVCDCHVCSAYLSSSWTKEFDNLCDWYTHLLRTSPTSTIHVHVLGNIITANPRNVKHILSTRFDNYPKGKPFSTILGDLLGRGIFNVDGDSWKFQRKMASLELGAVSVRSYAFEIVGAETKSRLIPLLTSFVGRNDVRLDLQDVFRRFSFDTTCKFSFGLDPGCLRQSLPESDFVKAFDTASKLSAERAMSPSSLIWKIKRLVNVGSEKKLREAIQTVNALAEQVINQKRGKAELSSDRDLLSRFMSNIDDDKYLRDIVVSFLLAGRDTVASALTSFFWLLSRNPGVRDTIREEADRVMGTKGQFASFHEMRQMHYLQAAVYECMRLYPPVQFDSKFAQDDDVLPDGTPVQRGSRVTYHPYAMGRMEGVWGPDCFEFKPERWLDEGGLFSPKCPYKYPVFQAGARVCLGKEMALMEMKSVALALVRRFDVLVPDSSYEPQFAPGLTATIRGGLPVVIKERVA